MNDQIAQMAMQQRMANQGAIIGGSTLSAPPADLRSLLARFRRAMEEASEAHAHARDIADTIHGVAPECAGEACAPARSGLIGEYEDVLDALNLAIGETRIQLRRISNGIPSMGKATLG